MRKLSPELLENVKQFIIGYVEDNGYAPSIRDICSGVPIKSTATAYKYVEALNGLGEISRSKQKTRTICIESDKINRGDFVSIPLVGKVAAGVPITAIENIDDSYLLPTKLWTGSENFMLTVSGTSMIEAGILNGDKIIVHQTSSCEDGDIVVAMVGDSATVKRFYKNGNKIILHPENSELSDIIVDGSEDFQIVGKVVGLLRQF